MLSQYVRSLSVGSARVHIINIGNISLPIGGHMTFSESDLEERAELQALRGDVVMPIQFIFAELPETQLLVDAGIYAIEDDSEFAIPGYEPPPGLVEQLSALGVKPEEIEHVVITHSHWDHFNGTTALEGDQHVPVFRNAKHYLGRADWDRAKSTLKDERSLESRTLGVLHREGLLELVDEKLQIGSGLEVISAPGETRGHQILRLHSEGQTLYALGDLYHHPVEFLNPEWMVTWADRDLTLKSRASLILNVFDEDALLVATHIPGVGKLRVTPEGNIWEAV